MRILAVSLFTITTCIINNVYAAESPEAPAEVLKDEAAKLNYSVGYQIGADFKYQEFEVRPETVLKGIEDALSGSEALMSRQEMRKTMADMGKHVANLKTKKRAQQAADYNEKNRQFLLENAKKKGVVTTASGLQYRVKENGRGAVSKPPGLNSTVLVHYRGKLIDGTVFASTRESGKPDYFQVNKVIKGWTEVLQLMRQGDHWTVFVPAELAYGESGAGASIPPNSTLLFDMELISIK